MSLWHKFGLRNKKNRWRNFKPTFMYFNLLMSVFFYQWKKRNILFSKIFHFSIRKFFKQASVISGEIGKVNDFLSPRLLVVYFFPNRNPIIINRLRISGRRTYLIIFVLITLRAFRKSNAIACSLSLSHH